MESLERNLEIYQRELAKAQAQVKSYQALIADTKAKLALRDKAKNPD